MKLKTQVRPEPATRQPGGRPAGKKDRLNTGVGWLLRLSGIRGLVRRIVGRDRVGILLYHDPDPGRFEEHLDYLTRHYNLISLDDLVGALESGDWTEIPEHALVVQIDDGYVRNFDLLPCFCRHGLRPTLYVCSHIADTHRGFWSKLEGGRAKRLRLLDNRRLLEKLQAEAGFSPERELSNRQALDACELAALSSHADVQSHGRFHFSLLTLDDATLREDLEASRRRVERFTGSPCEHFSYPYGDHGPREVEAVRAAGYRSGRTTLPGWNGPNADPYRLRIIADMPGNCSVARLEVQLTGLPRLLKWLGYRLFTRHLHSMRQAVLAQRRMFRPVE